MSFDLEQECHKRWEQGMFIEHGVGLPQSNYENVQWVPYETYMRAQLIDCMPGQVGKLMVDFPPSAIEDNELHIHPISDRCITVLKGKGEFVAERLNKIERFLIQPGDRVWMPRGTLHTFIASEHGLVVESLHNPFIPLDDPDCLVCPK